MIEIGIVLERQRGRSVISATPLPVSVPPPPIRLFLPPFNSPQSGSRTGSATSSESFLLRNLMILPVSADASIFRGYEWTVLAVQPLCPTTQVAVGDHPPRAIVRCPGDCNIWSQSIRTSPHTVKCGARVTPMSRGAHGIMCG
jgi:hypothetical protein